MTLIKKKKKNLEMNEIWTKYKNNYTIYLIL